LQGSINSRKWAYLAGLIDGDGTVTIDKSLIRGNEKYTPWLCICSTDLSTIKWVVSVFGGQYYKLRVKSDKHKDPYQWMACGSSHIQKIAEGVLPYLRVKRERMENLLAYLRLGAERIPSLRSDLREQAQYLSSQVEPLYRTDHDPNAILRKEDYAYFAGVFDAEGSVSINKSLKRSTKYQLDLRISNSDGRLMSHLLKNFGGTLSISQRGNKLPEGTWRISARVHERLILAILPYIHTKRTRLNIALMWKRSKLSDETTKEALFTEMKRLNIRGKSPTTNTLNCPENGQMIESDLVGDYESALPVMVNA
jgi:hypothetical protein